METVRLNDTNVQEIAAKAADVLRAGGVVLYPTDTLYGLGADALSNDAVARIVEIKGRDDRKPIHAIVADLDMAAEYADVTTDARLLVQEFGGKVTVIFKKRGGIDTGIAKGIETFGIRVPENGFCIAMCQDFGGPITATSANRAGETPLRSAPAILDQLGHTIEVNLVVDGGELPETQPSTVIDLSGSPVILRESAVSAADIWEVLRVEP
ncbi:MAG TPA: L-threonylcarbamoyladenylate synthase [Candidatus Paceibacterota bacterium]